MATTWVQWSGATTSGSYTEPLWQSWANDTTTTSASTTDVTWYAWSGSATTTATVDTTWNSWTTATYVYPTVTPEQRQAQEAQQRQYQEIIRANEEKAKAAKEKAEATLRAHLTEEQEKAWKENRAIFVTAPSGKRYKIKEGMSHNFFEVDAKGKHLKEFCAHVDRWDIPVADNVLAQLLALKYNEAAIVKKANIWDVTRHDRPLIQHSS